MAQKVADFIVQRLHEWGVRRVFGFPGDGINGLLGALHRAENKIEFIQVRHEEMAAFMATSGPGATHLITGMYDARGDHMPLLAIMGQAARTAVGSHYQQEIDGQVAFKDVASAYVQTAMAPAQVRHLMDRAIRTAVGERRVMHMQARP